MDISLHFGLLYKFNKMLPMMLTTNSTKAKNTIKKITKF